MRRDSRSDTSDTTDTFGQRNFGMAELGDRRRTRRLVALAERMVLHPGSTLPHKLHDPADLTALYRLCRRPEVTHEAVLAPHIGSASIDTRRNMSLLAVRNAIDALEGRRPPNLLNPEAWRG